MPRTGLRLKSPEQLVRESGADLEGHGLKRTIGPFQLVCFGIGAIVGTGIFVGLSDTVAEAGPAVLVSFALAALTCVFTAFSFAELGGAIPVSGSSYSYTYASLGERTAFLVGWCMLLEYGVSVSAVAIGWGQYLNELLGNTVGWRIPAALADAPGHGGVVNVPAVVVMLLAAVLLVRGVRESARATAAMAVIKVGILVLFCAVAFTAFRSGNLSPFAPEGIGGIGAGASLAFFSFIGFDAISTAGEEVKNPRRNIPFAILVTIGCVALLYCLVSVAALGAMPWQQVGGKPAALSLIVDHATGSTFGSTVVALGAVVAIASVVLTVMYGQTRILLSMSRDGLMPKVFERVSPKTSTPVANTWIVAIVFAAPAAVVPLDVVLDVTVIGTLAVMAVVNICVLALRRSHPGLQRRFRVPFHPVAPLLGVAFSLYLMYGLPLVTWIQFAVFVAVGAVVYTCYGRRRSRLAGSGTGPGVGPGAGADGPDASRGQAPADTPEGAEPAGMPAGH